MFRAGIGDKCSSQWKYQTRASACMIFSLHAIYSQCQHSHHGRPTFLYYTKTAAVTFIALTRFAVLLATSFADCTKCRLATGFAVLDDAMRQVLHSDEVCFAITVAADRTCGDQTFLYCSDVLSLSQKHFCTLYMLLLLLLIIYHHHHHHFFKFVPSVVKIPRIK